MKTRLKFFTPITAAVIILSSLTMPAQAGFLGLFGNDEDQSVPEPEEMQRREAAAQELLAKAKAEEQKGDFEDAADVYRKIVDKYPLTSITADAAIRSAELYESEGQPRDAFETYQKFIELSRGDRRFDEVLKEQYQLAQRAKSGEFKRRILIKLDIPMDAKVEMFETVAKNAPRSPLASASLFAIGEMQQEVGAIADAINAYAKVVADHPDSKEAPVAQFRIGELYVTQSERGAKDTTTMTSAREAYEDFLVRYPNHSLAKDAKARLGNVDSKQSEDLLKIAKFYEKTEKYRAAAIYYRDIIKQGGPDDVVAEAKSRLATLQASKNVDVTMPEPSAADTSVDSSLTKDRDDYVGPPSPTLTKREFTPRTSMPASPSEPLPVDDDGITLPGGNPLLPENGASEPITPEEESVDSAE